MKHQRGRGDVPSIAGYRSSPALTRVIAAVLVTLILSPFAGAQTLTRSELGELALEFADVTVADSRRGQARLMQVATLPGDGFALHLPFSPNRIERLVADGAVVPEGALMARVYGPELEHWAVEVQLLEERYTSAQARYERNKTLYEQQSLSATVWQTIVDRFHGLQMEHQHVRHVLEWLDIDASDPHGVTGSLRAPGAGYVLFEDRLDGDEPLVARILAPGSMRLTMEVPQESADAVSALATADCEYAVAHREGRVGGFSRRLWSVPLGDCLSPSPGLRLSGVPTYGFEGYLLPKSAVFGYRGSSYVALEKGAELELAAVSIAGESPEGFYVSTTQDLSARRVLIRSTSAVQGLLLGLGED